MWEEGHGFIDSCTVAQSCHIGQVEVPGSIPGNMRYHNCEHMETSADDVGSRFTAVLLHGIRRCHIAISGVSTVVESKLVIGHGGLSILLLRSEGPRKADCNRDRMLLSYHMQGFRYKVR